MSQASQNSRTKIERLFDGPIDIVGDIHGEIDALRDLIRHLGYDSTGEHPAGRRLVFIGDLTDRGPDSPAVLQFVRTLMDRGLAQCLLGNHELNLLRQETKAGNGWFFDLDHDAAKGDFKTCRHLDGSQRPAVLEFLATLPLALERADLRLVHATWDSGALESVRSSAKPTQDLFETYETAIHERARASGLAKRAAAEKVAHTSALTHKEVQIQFLPDYAEMEELEQLGNPIKILTSGIERRIPAGRVPFFATGKWRMLDRLPWWSEYTDDIPVIIGHYWRWPTQQARDAFSRGEPPLFDGLRNQQWFGKLHNVYCVDFAVGARYQERAKGKSSNFDCRLGAVRWPGRQLVFENGDRLDLE